MRSKQQNKSQQVRQQPKIVNRNSAVEPFGAYVPPLFKSPATKKIFCCNRLSKQHKHMNKMGDRILLRKDKQRWTNRRNTRLLVLTFYELEDTKHKRAKVLKPMKHTSFSISSCYQAKVSNLKGVYLCTRGN